MPTGMMKREKGTRVPMQTGMMKVGRIARGATEESGDGDTDGELDALTAHEYQSIVGRGLALSWFKVDSIESLRLLLGGPHKF